MEWDGVGPWGGVCVGVCGRACGGREWVQDERVVEIVVVVVVVVVG